MNILVTGGTGFVGKRLCRTLQADGHQITILSRTPDKVSVEQPGCRGVGELSPDLFDRRLDGIFNLAGEPIADKRWSDTQKQKLIDSRVGTTRKINALIEALEEKPDFLVSASAVGYYGDQQDNVVDEESIPSDEFTHDLCAAWETEALRAQSYGVRVALPRIGLVVGHGGFLQKMLPPFRMGVGGRLGSGQQWMPWIHINDLVRIFVHLAYHDQYAGPFNAVAPNPVRNSEFSDTLAKILHRPALLPMPELAIRILFGEMGRLLITGQQAFPRRLQRETEFSFQFDTLESALRDILDKE